MNERNQIRNFLKIAGAGFGFTTAATAAVVVGKLIFYFKGDLNIVFAVLERTSLPSLAVAVVSAYAVTLYSYLLIILPKFIASRAFSSQLRNSLTTLWLISTIFAITALPRLYIFIAAATYIFSVLMSNLESGRRAGVVDLKRWKEKTAEPDDRELYKLWSRAGETSSKSAEEVAALVDEINARRAQLQPSTFGSMVGQEVRSYAIFLVMLLLAAPTGISPRYSVTLAGASPVEAQMLYGPGNEVLVIPASTRVPTLYQSEQVVRRQICGTEGSWLFKPLDGGSRYHYPCP